MMSDTDWAACWSHSGCTSAISTPCRCASSTLTSLRAGGRAGGWASCGGGRPGESRGAGGRGGSRVGAGARCCRPPAAAGDSLHQLRRAAAVLLALVQHLPYELLLRGREGSSGSGAVATLRRGVQPGAALTL
jgi:hypothetical protein